MLVLSRQIGDTVKLSNGVTITVVEIHAGKVRLGFEAPADVLILRGELPERPVNKEKAGWEAFVKGAG